MGAEKGWNSIENLMACEAFVSASEDPVKGTSQKAQYFADTIEREFKSRIANRSDTVRTSEQSRSGYYILQRYEKIKKDCLEFEKCYQIFCAADFTG